MKLTAEEVRRVALLARLELTPQEETELIRQLDSILAYMDKLTELDTADVEPFSHAVDRTIHALREDKVTHKPNADVLLANAPDRDGTFFKVPKIIE